MATMPLLDNKIHLPTRMYSKFEHSLTRGHTEYCRRARWLEGLYIGNGQQWTDEDRAAARDGGFPLLEFNLIQVAINSIVSFQIKNRVDAVCMPVGGQATTELAETHSRVLKNISTETNYPWTETQIFTDGLIMQRGFGQVRMCYRKNIMGEVTIEDIDPLDVIVNPDAKKSSSDDWPDVQRLAWYTLDEIEEHFGVDKRNEIEMAGHSDSDWGDDDGTERNRFGMAAGRYSYDTPDAERMGMRRIRVIETQAWKYEKTKVAIFNHDDIRIIEGASKEKIAEWVAQGAIITTRPARKVRFTCTTRDTTLFDEWSPYPFLTISGFFPVFRRGLTSGVVDLAAGPQLAYNKLATQSLRIVNGVANTGWTFEEGTLVNHDRHSLAEQGAATGLIIEHVKGSKPPTKITPNMIPQGVDHFMQETVKMLKENTLPDAARGLVDGIEQSGDAINAKQFANQHQLALALDGLARFRNEIWRKVHMCVQLFYTNERMLRFTDKDEDGADMQNEIPLNTFVESEGGPKIVNDLSIGQYSILITESSTSKTSDSDSLRELLEIAKLVPGAIPPEFLIRSSNHPDRFDILRAMKSAKETAQPQVNPTEVAQVDKLKADADLSRANIALVNARTEQAKSSAVETNIRAIYGAVEAGQAISADPTISPLSDQVLGSAGFVDNDAPPIVGTIGQPITNAIATAGVPPPANPMTGLRDPLANNRSNPDPLSPPNMQGMDSPFDGVNKGIETLRNDG